MLSILLVLVAHTVHECVSIVAILIVLLLVVVDVNMLLLSVVMWLS